MKKIVLLVTIILLCTNLISCTGDIVEPVGDFSREDDGTLVWDGKRYVSIDELAGEFYFDITEEDVLLGQQSNFPFFPNSGFFANTVENADYIMCGSLSNNIAAVVYLREDLCQVPLCYVLQDTDYEFDFSSAFMKTEDVSYKKHIEGKGSYGTRIHFYVKDYPRLTVSLRICKLNEKWYYVDPDAAFELSEDFLNALMENNVLPK